MTHRTATLSSWLPARIPAALTAALLVCACSGSKHPAAGATGSNTIPSDATTGPRVAVSASDLAFADTALGDSGSRAVTITNVGAESLVITAVAVDGSGFTASGLTLPATLAPSQTADLTIAFAPASIGTTSAKISIASNDDSSPALLAASGTGVAATAGSGSGTGSGSGSGSSSGSGNGNGTGTGSAFSWTKPSNFDAALQTAISQQPAFMGGYGGQVSNPFPQMPGTTQFPAIQVTRPDAITLDQYFGRWAYRFYVDENSHHSNGLRAEFTGEGPYQYQTGDAARYEFSVYFDDAYQNSSWTDWNMFAQFHSPDFPAWGLHTAGGYLMMSPPGVDSDSLRIPMPARGQWHAFSWTIRWSPNSDGHATLLIDGQTAFDYSGPTMHPGEPYYYPKFGSYLANNPYTQITYETPWIITPL